VLALDLLKNVGFLNHFLFFYRAITLPSLSDFVESPAVEGFIANTLVTLGLLVIIVFGVGVVDVLILAERKEAIIADSDFKPFIVDHSPRALLTAFLGYIRQNQVYCSLYLVRLKKVLLAVHVIGVLVWNVVTT